MNKTTLRTIGIILALVSSVFIISPFFGILFYPIQGAPYFLEFYALINIVAIFCFYKAGDIKFTWR